MKWTSAVQIVRGGSVCLALLGVTSGAALAQTIGSENPRIAPAEPPAPAGDCQPIGLTASGEAVFPFQCKDFIERQKNANRKNAAKGKQKPTAADKKPEATEEKTGAKQQETAVPENSKLATETVGTVPLPKRAVRERVIGPPGCTHFSSYNSETGTYRAYDGKRRQCREVMSTATTTKAGPPALQPPSSEAPLQSASSTAAVDTDTTSAKTVDSRPTVDVDTTKAAPPALQPDSSKATLQSTGSTVAVDTDTTSAKTADSPPAVDVDTTRAAPPALQPDSSKATLQSAGSTAAVDTDKTSASTADSRSTVDVDTTKAGLPALQPDSSKAPLQSADSTATVDTDTTSANTADSRSTVDVDARKTEADVAAATMLAEHLTVATAAPPPDMKGINSDNSDPAEMLARGNAERTAPVPASATDLLVAVLIARPEITSVSGLTGKTIAIDDRYSASNGSVRIAIVAAGASEFELSAGQTTAISRLIKGEVPAAILALVPAGAAEGLPEIAGFKILRIPLSPRS